jgi:hypothetical protein
VSDSTSTLDLKVREAIRDRKLPDRRPSRMWAGKGSGACCAICAAPVGPTEIEYEVVWSGAEAGLGLEPGSAAGVDGGSGNVGGDSFRLHLDCWRTWQRQRDSRVSGSDAVRSGPAEPPAGTHAQNGAGLVVEK